MTPPTLSAPAGAAKPILLFDDECGVCRHIASWVRRAAQVESGVPCVTVRPIGEDPAALRVINPSLDIWAAYATIHLVMPDGSMKVGGEAIADLFRTLPGTRWFAWSFSVRVLGWRPFQAMLNVAYLLLADIRPIFGCESCGAPSAWVRPFVWVIHTVGLMFGKERPNRPEPHFKKRSPSRIGTAVVDARILPR